MYISVCVGELNLCLSLHEMCTHYLSFFLVFCFPAGKYARGSTRWYMDDLSSLALGQAAPAYIIFARAFAGLLLHIIN